MTTRALVLTLGVGILAWPGIGRAEILRFQSETSFGGARLSVVRVENPRGFVRVTPSADDSVRLTAVKESRGIERARAERMIRGTRVTAQVRDGVLEVKVEYAEQERTDVSLWRFLKGDVEVPRFQVRLGLEVPAALALDVRTTSGDIQTDRIRGSQALKSTSGDIEVQAAGGPLRATSTSGDVEAANVRSARLGSTSGDVRVVEARGPLVIGSASGDIAVRGATDSLSIETASGDVSVTDAPRGVAIRVASGDVVVRGAAGVVRAQSSSGDVSLQVADPLRRVEVASQSGDVSVRYLADVGCDLNLGTSSGTIDVSLPVDIRSSSRHALRGTVGNGSVPINLKTASGDITVRGPRK